jgi:hypothetical protein
VGQRLPREHQPADELHGSRKQTEPLRLTEPLISYIDSLRARGAQGGRAGFRRVARAVDDVCTRTTRGEHRAATSSALLQPEDGAWLAQHVWSTTCSRKDVDFLEEHYDLLRDAACSGWGRLGLDFEDRQSSVVSPSYSRPSTTVPRAGRHRAAVGRERALRGRHRRRTTRSATASTPADTRNLARGRAAGGRLPRRDATAKDGSARPADRAAGHVHAGRPHVPRRSAAGVAEPHRHRLPRATGGHQPPHQTTSNSPRTPATRSWRGRQCRRGRASSIG